MKSVYNRDIKLMYKYISMVKERGIEPEYLTALQSGLHAMRSLHEIQARKQDAKHKRVKK